MLAKLQYEGRDPTSGFGSIGPKAGFATEERVGSWRGNLSNRLIHGDNELSLRLLAKDPSVRGKVRLVYIDPPFATGQSFSRRYLKEVAYLDTLQGPAYLEFLRQRLILIGELMAADGSIYVHIDCKVGHYVKMLMDEVFGDDHFINDITRIKCNPKNFERKAYGNFKDMILFYSKGNEYVWNDARQRMANEEIERLFPRVDKSGRRYTTNPLHAPGVTIDGPTGREWKGMLPPKGRHWRYSPSELSRLDSQGLIEWSRTRNPRLRIYADDHEKNGKKRQDIWDDFKDPPYPTYPTEKNLEMLKVIVSASSNPGDVVLDAFCGSGTSLLAAESLGRKWIGIDASPVAIRVSRSRLKSQGATFELQSAKD